MISVAAKNIAKKSRAKKKKPAGLRYWMLDVLEQCDRASAGFAADPVHDLRVALRRCRSMADGLIALDPDPDWKAMKKAGKRVFERLGALRDVQVMMEWVVKLFPEETTEQAKEEENVAPALSPATAAGGEESHAEAIFAFEAIPELNSSEHQAEVIPTPTLAYPQQSPYRSLLQILRAREAEQKIEARAALEDFDRKQWRQWSKSLPQRATRIRPGSAVYKHLALERWTLARDLHNRALRNRSQVAFHTLRIGIKRFRYIVENFLPVEHTAWSRDLKEVQDLLGEVHDLDVLWATALGCHIFPDEAARKEWHETILKERGKRIDRYREKMVGPDSCWSLWRAGMPQGRQVEAIAKQRIMLWAKALDPDFAHAERVAKFAQQLYSGLQSIGLAPTTNGTDAQVSLHAAAILHDVGKSEGDKGHHKASYELIRSYPPPLGVSAEFLQRAAAVARFHRGALPTRSHKVLRDLLPDEQKLIIQLAAILRLANAFDAAHDGHIRSVKIEGNASRKKNEVPVRRNRTRDGLPRKPEALAAGVSLQITAEGYTPNSATAQTIAAERHLLETVLRRPVIITPSRG